MLTKFIAAIVVLLSASFALPLSAATNITSCETISTSGNYTIATNATLTSSGGDCLVITASNVTITASGNTIQGTGASGAGIHVMSGAKTFTLNPTSTSILNYSAGIELDGIGAEINSDSSAPLFIQQVSAGILISGGTDNEINGVGTHAAYNGIWILNGSNNLVTGYQSSINQGISSTTAGEVVASDSDGIRIDNSSGNLIYQVDVTQGTEVGVHIVNGSQYNTVLSNLVQNSDVGISVKADGSGSNFILYNTLKNNQLDLQDNNSNCDHDFWSGNTFSTDSPSCAQ